jgi:hypothetical protein
MHLTISFPAVAAALTVLSLTNATPLAGGPNATLQKRANWPNNINIGINEKRIDNSGAGMWTAWANGQDPCNHHADLDVYENSESPCNIRFSLDGYDDQWTMQGCGGDLSIWRNGQYNMGSCSWAPGHVGCIAGAGYSGRWQCHVNK